MSRWPDALVSTAVLGVILFAVPSVEATVQATAQGVIWSNDLNGGSVAVNDLQNAFPPVDEVASVNGSYLEDGFTFDYLASASFPLGQLKVRSTASSDETASGSINAQTGVPASLARLQDELAFTPADNNPYDVTVTLSVNGSFSYTGDVFDQLVLSNLSIGTGGGPSDQDTHVFSLSASPESVLLTTTVTLTGPQTVFVLAELGADIYFLSGPEQLIDLNFGSTAQLAVESDASFNSGSGVLFRDLVISALTGDFDSSGGVGQSDLNAVLLNWGSATAPAGFDEAALSSGGPFDGNMSQNELNDVLLNWGNTAEPGGNAVPEPGGLALAGLAGLGIMGGRRRA